MHSHFNLKRQLKFNVETDNLCTFSLLFLFHSKIDQKGDRQRGHVHGPSTCETKRNEMNKHVLKSTYPGVAAVGFFRAIT